MVIAYDKYRKTITKFLEASYHRDPNPGLIPALATKINNLIEKNKISALDI